jgi:hypothetical protein
LEIDSMRAKVGHTMPAVAVLRTYLEGLRAIRLTGEAVAETSYYGQLERLLNEAGNALSPMVTCVLTTKNRGAGVPDGGLFIARQAVAEAGDSALLARAPERGVMEVKGPAQDVIRVAHSAQVRRYLARYGKVLVCTYRDFVVYEKTRRSRALTPPSSSQDSQAFPQARIGVIRDNGSLPLLASGYGNGPPHRPGRR